MPRLSPCAMVTLVVGFGAAGSMIAAGAAGASATTPTATPTAPSSPTSTAPTSPTSTAPTSLVPAAPPAAARATVELGGAFGVRGREVTVTRRRLSVTGTVRPYVAGQSVILTAVAHGRRLLRTSVAIKPARSGGYGQFSARLTPRRPGTVSITVEHAPSSGMGRFLVRRRVDVLSPRARPGSRGPFVDLIQQRLAALHFYIPHTGVYDNGTALAVDAYHRLLGWGTSSSLDGRTVSYLLNGWGKFKVRYADHGRHAEGDLAKQLLALINGSKVQLIFPISSGKPSTPTILGNFRVYSRVPGYLPDGMYYSSFFIGGYAIHGYDPAPDYPASHGCMRLPIPDALTAYRWLAMGDWVDVYY